MTQRSVTYLKGRWETGDIPTQADYGDLLDSFVSLEASAAQTLSGSLILPGIDTTRVSAVTVSADSAYINTKLFHSKDMAVSAALGTQAGGTILIKDINVVYGNDVLGFGCVIATAEPGRIQHIINTNTTVLTIFPSSGCAFIGSAANASIVLAKNTTMIVTHASAVYGITRGTV